MKNNEEELKVILLGESGVGKTAIIKRYLYDQFNLEHNPSSTMNYVEKQMTVKNKNIRLNIWDTIGQEKYRSLTKIFFKDSKIVLYVYDITNRKSFEALENWRKIIADVLGDVPTIGVVGNKCDLYLQEQVKENEGKKYADDIGAKFIYTSAKLDAINFKKFLEDIVKDYVNKFGVTKNSDIKINKKKINDKKKDRKCC